MTLISVHNSEGCKGRRDEKCYAAAKKRCSCCCGGLNHGRGLQEAKDLTSRYADIIAQAWDLEHPEEKMRIKPMQLELFA